MILQPPPQNIPTTVKDNDLNVLGFFKELIDSVFHIYNFVKTLNKLSLDGIAITNGTGTPESAVTGNVGDLFLRTDGGASTVLYVKESGTGNTGWAAK